MSETEMSDAASILAGTQTETDPELETESTESEDTSDQEIDSSAESTEDSQESQSEEDGPDEDSDKPKLFKDLAEKLDMSAKDLYAYELGDGLTIGHLKDRMKELTQADDLIAKAEVHKADAEREVMVHRDAVQIAWQQLGRQPTQAELQVAQQAREDLVSRETALAMQLIPDWKDPAIADTERKMVTDELLASRYSPLEVEMADHRLMGITRRLVKLEQRIRDAGKTEVKPKRNQKPKPSRKSTVSSQDKAVSDFKAGKISQTDAVRTLLTG